MDRIAVFVDDLQHARDVLEPLVNSSPHDTEWAFFVCAPALPHRANKWLSAAQRSHWRQQWAHDLMSALMPLFAADAREAVRWQVANRSATAGALRQPIAPHSRLLDARRPRAGQPRQRLGNTARSATRSDWATPLAITSGVSAMLALVD